ncbi:hypothetical protein [Geoglobus ahangari]
MPLSSTDIKFYLSGGSSNTDPNLSLGGAISSTEITDAADNNLFDDVSGDEAANGSVEYRCFYVKNTHASITLQNAVIYISAETPAGDQLDIGLDPAGVGDGTNTGVATTIADETTAPSGVTFSHPLDKSSGLAIGNLGPGQCIAVWVRRTVPAGTAAYAANSATFRVEGEWTE